MVRKSWLLGLFLLGLVVPNLHSQTFLESNPAQIYERIQLPDGTSRVKNECATMLVLENTGPAPFELDYPRPRLGKRTGQKLLVPVVFHVITDDEGNGYVKPEQLQMLIDRLNDVYGQYGYQFYIRTTTLTENRAWWVDPFSYYKVMARALAVDPSHNVNVYIVGMREGKSNGPVGFAFVPWAFPEDSFMHGIMLSTEQVPSAFNPNEHVVAVHEFGHYFGLLHTFEGGCVNGPDVGDMVEDTPAQKDGLNIYQCDENLDTCPDDPGKDPVRNYMNYSDCRNEFTPGQVARMQWALSKYRPSLGILVNDAISTIRDVRTLASGGQYAYIDSVFTIRGIVTVAGAFNNPAFVQDTTGGIAIYDQTFADSVDVGDFVEVTGKLTVFNGLAQLTNVQFRVLDRGFQPAPVPLSTSTMIDTIKADRIEGRLVKLENVWLVDPTEWKGDGTSFNVRLTDGFLEVTMRIDKDTDLASMPAPPGDAWSVVGILGQYDTTAPYLDGYQLMPRHSSDITTLYKLSGVVTDLNNGTPLNMVMINVGKRSVSTTTDGRYELFLPPGFYEITYDLWGFQKATRRVDIQSSSVVVNVALKALRAVTAYQNGFEQGDDIGASTVNQGGTNSWHRSGAFTYNGTTVTPVTGDSMLVFGGANGYAANESATWRTLPGTLLDLTGYRSATLHLKYYIQTAEATDRLYIMAYRPQIDQEPFYLDLNQDWIADDTDYLSGDSQGWKTLSLDLAMMTGPDRGNGVQIVFLFESDGQNQSGFGVAIDSVVIEGKAADPLAAPGNLTATSFQTGQVNLNWSAPSAGPVMMRFYRRSVQGNASIQSEPAYIEVEQTTRVAALQQYRVYRYRLDQRTSDWEWIGETTATQFVDTTVVDGAGYVYVVTAVYDEGESRYSEGAIAEAGMPALQTVPYTQDFEGLAPGQLPAGWTVWYFNKLGWFAADSAIGASEAVTIPSHTTFMLVNDDFVGKYARSHSYLFSPWFDLTGVDSVQLQFDAFSQPMEARHLVLVRTRLESPLNFLSTAIDTIQLSRGWKHYYYNLSSRAGGQKYVQVIFVYEDLGVHGGAWAIDNFELKPLVTGGLAGNVQSTLGQEKLHNAVVSIPFLGLETLTDSLGNYLLTGVPVGTYTVKVSGFDHQDSLISNITITAGQQTTLNVSLKKFYQPPQALFAYGDTQKRIFLKWYPPLPPGELKYDDGKPDALGNTGYTPQDSEMVAVKFIAPWRTFVVTDVAAFVGSSLGIDYKPNLNRIGPIQIVADSLGLPNLNKVFFELSQQDVQSYPRWHAWPINTTITADNNTFWVVIRWDEAWNGAIVYGDKTEPIDRHSLISTDGGRTWQLARDFAFMDDTYKLDLMVRAYVAPPGSPPVSQVQVVPPAEPLKQPRLYRPAKGYNQREASADLPKRRLPAIPRQWSQLSQLAGVAVRETLTGFEIYRRVAHSGAPPTMIAKVDGGTFTYVDTAVPYDQLQEYFVRALYNVNDRSALSKPFMAATQTLHYAPVGFDFEGDDGKFVSFDGWEWGQPTYATMPDSVPSGKNVWGTLLDTTYAKFGDYPLVSPPIKLPDSKKITLEFVSWWEFDPWLGHGEIHVSTDFGQSWQRLDSWDTSPFKGRSRTWQNVSFDLSKFAGDTVNIKFWLRADWNEEKYAGWLIDDVAIVTGTAGAIAGQIMTKDGRPVNDASVQLKNQSYDQTVKSDLQGKFRFQIVPPGQYALHIQAFGFQPLTDSVTVVADSLLQLSYTLERAFVAPELTVLTYGPYAKLNWSLPQQPQQKARARETDETDRPRATAALKAFKLYRAEGNQTPVLIDSLSGDTFEYVDKTVEGGKNYLYRIVSVYDAGESPPAETIYDHPVFLSIADTKADADQDFVPDLLDQRLSVRGIVTAAQLWDLPMFYVQQDSAGMRVLLEDTVGVPPLQEGDELYLTGLLEQEFGETYLKVLDARTLHVLSSGNSLPEPVEVRIAEIGEALEGRLVTVKNVKIVNRNDWPPAGQEGGLWVTDGTDSLELLISRRSDLPGNPPPDSTFNITGIIGQFTDDAPPNNGYLLQPRSRKDFEVVSVTGVQSLAGVPEQFLLQQNYPNPFNPSTVIVYGLPREATVRLVIYDVLGRPVRVLVDGRHKAGVYKTVWDGLNDAGQPVAGGLYLYKLQTESTTLTRKMLFIR